jgi:hypothetical protein
MAAGWGFDAENAGSAGPQRQEIVDVRGRRMEGSPKNSPSENMEFLGF